MMLKKCLTLFITGIILIAIGGIGLAALVMNGISINGISIGSSSDVVEVIPSIAIPIEETEEIHSLDFSANSGIFNVLKGNSFSIETNMDTVGYELTDGCLKIENTSSASFMNFEDAAIEIIVTIPERHFKEVKLSLNAGELNADNITTDNLIINLNAGSAIFNNITAASSTEINMNLGECIFENSSFNVSEINMDAGEMTFEECKLTGKNEINLDLGELNMGLIGKRSDYELDIENDLGEVNVDGVPYNGDRINEGIEPINPIGTININLDLGECNIDFMEE